MNDKVLGITNLLKSRKFWFAVLVGVVGAVKVLLSDELGSNEEFFDLIKWLAVLVIGGTAIEDVASKLKGEKT